MICSFESYFVAKLSLDIEIGNRSTDFDVAMVDAVATDILISIELQSLFFCCFLFLQIQIMIDNIDNKRKVGTITAIITMVFVLLFLGLIKISLGEFSSVSFRILFLGSIRVSLVSSRFSSVFFKILTLVRNFLFLFFSR